MRTMTFAAAIEEALIQAMAADPRIVVFGEDVQMIRRNLYTRFGGERVRDTPISESAFLGAGVAAAMAGLRPVVEIIMVDFLGVAMDALLNHAAKIESFSGGRWRVPLVVRTGCGGGYGDGGQHEQSLWGWLAHIPGLSVVVPATPADAGGLILAALEAEDPVIFLEHKLLADYWLDSLGAGGRQTVHYDVPPAGAAGPVPGAWQPLPLGKAVLRREGDDLTIATLGVSVHRALEAAEQLHREGISAAVVDLRSVAPLDTETIVGAVAQTGKLLVVDEDYEAFGLSGELAALVLEAGLQPAYARVCTRTTIPYTRSLEDATLPNVTRILSAARRLMAV
jgi:acetoin:2,6-dichlorophenolindophenol oxidoreductase subunit beta